MSLTVDSSADGGFLRELGNAVRWCEKRVERLNPKWCLRSSELSPVAMGELCNDPTVSLFGKPELVSKVSAKRATALRESLPAVSSVEILEGSRILVCRYEESNFNYLSATESLWYLDGHDQPPWDTWIGCWDECLFSWVPKEFVELVERGMTVDCFGVLMWVESANVVVGEHADRIIGMCRAQLQGPGSRTIHLID